MPSIKQALKALVRMTDCIGILWDYTDALPENKVSGDPGTVQSSFCSV